MPDQEDRTPKGVDLSHPTESTRRQVYDAVVRIHFQPTPEEIRKAQEEPDDHWVPDYGPDDAELTILFVFGRCFAIWRALEEKDAEPTVAEWRRWVVLRVTEDPAATDSSGGSGLTFLEV
jgi:hypothetical protein